MLDGLLDYLKSWFAWLIDWLKGLILAVLLPVLRELGQLIPPEWHDGIATAISWLGYIDTWVPLAFGIKLLVAYYAIKAVLIVIKYVLKAIPGVWG